MAQAHASAIIEAPVEAVWAAIRDFGALAAWHPAIARSEIERGLDADVVGCIRVLTLKDGGMARERLMMLDDSRYDFTYNFETPAFPIENYAATLELIPVTSGDRTFARWDASFDERPEDAGHYASLISDAVFAAGLAALATRLDGTPAPTGVVRWQGHRPAKVFCSSVLQASAARVWAEMRNFAGMDRWHPEITAMRMLDGSAADRVSGVRGFRFGDSALQEQLTFLSDPDMSFRYKINVSSEPWRNYHSGVALQPVTASGGCFAVWMADWTASADDDLRLIPMVHDDVFQRALDTLDTMLCAT